MGYATRLWGEGRDFTASHFLRSSHVIHVYSVLYTERPGDDGKFEALNMATDEDMYTD